MKFKNERDEILFMYLSPVLIMAIFDMEFYLAMHGHEMVITATISTKEMDDKLGRVSSTHRTARACDIRISNLPKELVKEMVIEFNEKYKDVAAINKAGQKRFAVLKIDHIHLQIHSKYSIENDSLEFF